MKQADKEFSLWALILAIAQSTVPLVGTSEDLPVILTANQGPVIQT